MSLEIAEAIIWLIFFVGVLRLLTRGAKRRRRRR